MFDDETNEWHFYEGATTEIVESLKEIANAES